MPKELSELSADSQDVFKPGHIDRYMKRPREMNETTYADFVACYTYKGKSKKRTGEPDDQEEEEENENNPEVDDLDQLDLVSSKTSNRIQLADEGQLIPRRRPKVIQYCRFDL